MDIHMHTQARARAHAHLYQACRRKYFRTIYSVQWSSIPKQQYNNIIIGVIIVIINNGTNVWTYFIAFSFVRFRGIACSCNMFMARSPQATCLEIALTLCACVGARACVRACASMYVCDCTLTNNSKCLRTLGTYIRSLCVKEWKKRKQNHL